MTSRAPAWLLVSAAILAAGTAPAAATAAETRLAFQPSSRVLLAGSTNLHAWRCSTTKLDGGLRLSAEPRRVLAIVERLEAEAAARGVLASPDVPGDLEAALRLEIPVAALDCGNRAMERDLQSTLDAADHPVIRYRFQRVEAARVDRGGAGENPRFELRVRGEMSLAGTTRPVTFTVVGRRSGETGFRLAGRIPLSMTHFGIDPPTALLGLIQVDDDLTVEVSLVLDLDAATLAALVTSPPPPAAPAARTPASAAGARERVR